MARGPFDVETDFPLFVTTGDENGPKKIVPNIQYLVKLLEKLGIIKFLHVHTSNPPVNNIRDTVWYKPPVSVADQTTQNGTVLIYDSVSASWVDAETNGDAWHRYLTELEPEEQPREILEGVGPPSTSVGRKGDLYVQSDPSRVYYKRADGTWASLAAGAVMLESSTSPPANSFGNDGEYAVTPGGVFGPKTGGVWPTTPVSGEHTAAASVPLFASQAQAEAGVDNSTIMSPLRVAQAITVALSANIPAFASQVQAEAGTNNDTIMTPLRVAQYLTANPPFAMCGLPALATADLTTDDLVPVCNNGTGGLASLSQIKGLIHTLDLCALPAFDPATDTLADTDKVIVCNSGSAKQINVSDLRASIGGGPGGVLFYDYLYNPSLTATPYARAPGLGPHIIEITLPAYPNKIVLITVRGAPISSLGTVGTPTDKTFAANLNGSGNAQIQDTDILYIGGIIEVFVY